MRKRTTKEIFKLNAGRKQPEIPVRTTAVLHNIRSLHNVGAAFRTADALGIGKLILSGYTPCPPRPEISKTALGADEFVAWDHFATINELLVYLKKGEYCLIGIEQTNQSLDLPGFTWPKNDRIAVIFGNEVTGIDEELLPHLNHVVEIPQFGKKHSFNISVSFGIVFYDMLTKSLTES
ncbi:MAG: RNA methyltransferase [Cyclonatronaceae bacterium]